jgi:hypothetical protein
MVSRWRKLAKMNSLGIGFEATYELGKVLCVFLRIRFSEGFNV